MSYEYSLYLSATRIRIDQWHQDASVAAAPVRRRKRHEWTRPAEYEAVMLPLMQLIVGSPYVHTRQQRQWSLYGCSFVSYQAKETFE